MFDWNDLRYFLAIARAGTLAGAATATGANATTVGRRLGALEEDLAARLFDRTPEGYKLTAAGEELLVHAQAAEAAALGALRGIVGADGRVAGRVRLATTETLATRFIAPHLARFHAQHPELTLEITCALRSVDLTRREADVALRLTRPRELDVVARALTRIELDLFASRAYLAAAGAPSGASLAGHRVLLFADTAAFAIENDWWTPRLAGAHIALRSDSVNAIYSATLAGAGIALLPRRVAEIDPELVPLHAPDPPAPRTVWQGVHRDLAKNARVLAVLQFLATVVDAHAE